MSFTDFRGGTVTFNQAQFQMIRLHELSTKINECWLNFGGFVDDLPAHQVMFNVLTAYFIEIESTLTEKESKQVNELLVEIEALINTNPLFTLQTKNGLGGPQVTRKVNQEMFFLFRRKLRDYQKLILENAQRHGIGNPTKRDPSEAILH